MTHNAALRELGPFSWPSDRLPAPVGSSWLAWVVGLVCRLRRLRDAGRRVLRPDCATPGSESQRAGGLSGDRFPGQLVGDRRGHSSRRAPAGHAGEQLEEDRTDSGLVTAATELDGIGEGAPAGRSAPRRDDRRHAAVADSEKPDSIPTPPAPPAVHLAPPRCASRDGLRVDEIGWGDHTPGPRQGERLSWEGGRRPHDGRARARARRSGRWWRPGCRSPPRSSASASPRRAVGLLAAVQMEHAEQLVERR